MIEDYVSFETAKRLKEKGFESEDCHIAYDENGEMFWHGDYSKNRYGIVDAPTLQTAMRWLREKHKIFLNINFIPEHFCFTYRIVHNGVEEKYAVYSSTYEEACEAAIKYCSENLL